MTSGTVTVLGRAARAARRAGLGRGLALARDAVDAPLVRLGRPPLQASGLTGVEVRGFLRHRSFLADVARPDAGGYQRLLAATVKPGATVIDGGAHIGVYSLIAAAAAGPTGRVLAFEPDPYNLAALRANARRAQRSGSAPIEVVAKALADGPGRTTFLQSSGTISGSLADRDGSGLARALEVELTSIDDELPVAPASLVVKLNVEGAEQRVLAGMQRTLAGCPDIALFVELNPKALRAAGTDPGELVARLEGLGFTLQSIDPLDESLRPLPPLDELAKGHMLCRRRC